MAQELTREDIERIKTNAPHHTEIVAPKNPIEGFTPNDNSQYTRVVAICYPRNNYFVFETLIDGEWTEDKAKWQETYDRALAAAQSLANRLKVPVRIKEVIDV